MGHHAQQSPCRGLLYYLPLQSRASFAPVDRENRCEATIGLNRDESLRSRWKVPEPQFTA